MVRRRRSIASPLLATLAALATACATPDSDSDSDTAAPRAPIASGGGPEASAAPLSPSHAITARVVADGQPVAGAIVSLSDGSSAVARTAYTDATGVARFADLSAGGYELWAQHETTVSPLGRAVLAPGGAQPDVELALEPGAEVRGHLDVRGAGMPADATVLFVPLDIDHAVRQVRVDANGEFAVPALPRGRWEVLPEAIGHFAAAPYVVSATGERAAIDVALERGGAVSGRLLDAGGAPLSGATIVLRAQGAARSGAARLPLARAAGQGGLRWVHPLAETRHMPLRDTRRFGAARDGLRPAECGQGHCGVDLGSRRGSVIHAAADGVVAAVIPEIREHAGRFVVIDHPGGLRSFYMHLDEIRPDLEAGQRVAGGEPIATLGRTGVIRSGPHLHFALAHEEGGRSWYIDPEPMLRYAIVLPSEGSLEAAAMPGARSVRLAATDVAPARALERAAPVTDASGRFHIEGVAPGTYVATAFHPLHAPAASASFAITSGGEEDGVALTALAGVVIVGHVRGPHGPVAGARVLAEEDLGESIHSVDKAVTDSSGRFELRPLTGPVALTVTAAGFGVLRREVELASGGARPARRDEAFDLTRADAELRGRVVDGAGFAVPGARIVVTSGPARVAPAVTDGAGRFTVVGVPAGEYEIEVSSSSHAATRALLDTARGGDVALEPGVELKLVVRDGRTGAPLRGARVEAQGPGGRRAVGVAGTSGVVELPALRAGAWTFTIASAGYASAERSLAVEGRAAERVVELSRAATLAGVVRDADGERVGGATVRVGAVSTVTDQDGRFRLPEAPSGSVVIEAERGEERGTTRIELGAGEERVTLELRIQ